MSPDQIAFGHELSAILAKYKSGNKIPLTDHELEDLVKTLYLQIKLLEGKITFIEYQTLLLSNLKIIM